MVRNGCQRGFRRVSGRFAEGGAEGHVGVSRGEGVPSEVTRLPSVPPFRDLPSVPLFRAPFDPYPGPLS